MGVGYHARSGMGALVASLAAVSGVGLESRLALGQDVAKVAYQETNLSAYGVPDVSGVKPYHTKMLDKTDKIPGAETLHQMYQVGKAVIGTYSIKNRVYAIVFDPDGKPPLEYSFDDKDGKGLFVPSSPDERAVVPDWVIQQVVSVKDLKQ